jgi:hypothetical protein
LERRRKITRDSAPGSLIPSLTDWLGSESPLREKLSLTWELAREPSRVPGNVVEATEQLIMKHNRNWGFGGGNGFDLGSLPPLHAAGFSSVETFSYDLDIPYTAEGWRGRIRASAGVGASLAPAAVEAFDAELARLLDGSFPGALLKIPHRVFTIVAARARQG